MRKNKNGCLCNKTWIKHKGWGTERVKRMYNNKTRENTKMTDTIIARKKGGNDRIANFLAKNK